MTADVVSQLVPVDTTALFPLTIRDLSKDDTATLPPGGAPGVPVAVHQVTFEVELLTNDTLGWSIQKPLVANTAGGDVVERTLRVSVDRLVTNPYLEFRLHAVLHTPAGEDRSTVQF